MPTLGPARRPARRRRRSPGLPTSAPAGQTRRLRGSTAMISHFFIDRPIFAAVLSIVITLTGGIALCLAADRAVSPDHAAGGAGLDQLPGRQRPGRGRHGGGADRAAGQRRPGHALHVVADGQRRLLHADRHLRPRHRPEHGPGHGAEPRDAGHAAAAELGAEAGHHHPQEDARHPDDRQLLLAGRPLRRPLPEQLRHDQRQGRAAARRRASRTSPTWASATTASAPGSTRRSWRRAT